MPIHQIPLTGSSSLVKALFIQYGILYVCMNFVTLVTTIKSQFWAHEKCLVQVCTYVGAYAASDKALNLVLHDNLAYKTITSPS